MLIIAVFPGLTRLHRLLADSGVVTLSLYRNTSPVSNTFPSHPENRLRVSLRPHSPVSSFASASGQKAVAVDGAYLMVIGRACW